MKTITTKITCDICGEEAGVIGFSNTRSESKNIDFQLKGRVVPKYINDPVNEAREADLCCQCMEKAIIQWADILRGTKELDECGAGTTNTEDGEPLWNNLKKLQQNQRKTLEGLAMM